MKRVSHNSDMLRQRENLEVGEIRHNGPKWWSVEQTYTFFPVLGQLRNRLGGQLSGGEQQMLTIARTLMGDPTLLLLDEPTEGLAPLVVMELGKKITHLKALGLAILLAAQNMQFATKVADYAYIMECGRIAYSGTIDQVRRGETAVKAYLVV